jgi:hypothetical protein
MPATLKKRAMQQNPANEFPGSDRFHTLEIPRVSPHDRYWLPPELVDAPCNRDRRAGAHRCEKQVTDPGMT